MFKNATSRLFAFCITAEVVVDEFDFGFPFLVLSIDPVFPDTVEFGFNIFFSHYLANRIKIALFTVSFVFAEFEKMLQRSIGGAKTTKPT